MNRDTCARHYEPTEVTERAHSLIVDWADGHQSAFHYLWLRDACQCERCGIPGFGDKTYAVVDFPEDVHPECARIDLHGRLVVEWSGEGHVSTYDSQWLRSHCYSKQERERRRSKSVLWDNNRHPDLDPIDYGKLVSDEETQFELTFQLQRL